MDARRAEAGELARIRQQLDMLDAKEWLMVADGEIMRVDAAGKDGSRLHILTFQPCATPDEIQFCAHSVTNVRFLLGLLDRAMAAMRAASPSRPSGTAARRDADRDAGKDFAAEAAMKCGEPAFKAFMEERHGLERPLTDDRVAQKLRSVLGITSRAELNRDDRAAAAWRALRDDFKGWRARG